MERRQLENFGLTKQNLDRINWNNWIKQYGNYHLQAKGYKQIHSSSPLSLILFIPFIQSKLTRSYPCP